MAQLIDLCAKAIQLENIKTFEKGIRRYVFCPCFQEIRSVQETKSFFGKIKDITTQSTYKYVGAYPYGAVLSDQETPSPTDRYAIKTDGGFFAVKLLEDITQPPWNLGRKLTVLV